MPTYYDFLGILSSASQPEVNSAIDQQYDHWRRLTTHHEQETVENATRALRILEQIRNTLSDPISREKYNNSIGLGNQVGGLADPSAPPIVSSRIPVASPPPSGSMSNQHRIDAWLCPRCQTANVIGTRHCKNCGVAIGIDCPNCGRLTEASTKHCSNCGVNVQDALRKRKTLEDEQRKHREMQEAERIRVQREQERVNAEQASKKLVKQKQQSRRSCITWTFAIAGLLVCCVAASAIVPLALRKGQVANAPILQLPTVDPLIAAQMPKYSGENIAVVAQLQDVSDDRFQINFEVENLTQANITLAFLTSDVVVADDIGNVYPQQ